MDALGIIAIVLAVAGIAGGIIPMLPGPPLSWCALLFTALSGKAANSVPVSALVIWGVVAVLLVIFDYILPGKLTKLTGGHKSAERGATIGLILGMFLTPVGMILGSFIGAFIGEYMVERQDVGASLKAAVGSFTAFILTTGLKLIFSALVLWQVLVHLF